jgi:hypothetical protein
LIESLRIEQLAIVESAALEFRAGPERADGRDRAQANRSCSAR